MNTMIGRTLIILAAFVFHSCMEPDHFVITTRLSSPMITIPLSPGQGYVWIDGEWFWNGSNYGWRDGYWSHPANGYRYVPGQWKSKRDGWYWRQGRWKK